MNNWPTRNDADEMTVPEGEGSLCAMLVYEDEGTRERATRICDGLVQKFWREFWFDFNWWRFDFLRDSEIARAAANAATQADLILFSARAARELPPHVTRWIESWLPLRSGRGGMLAAMIGTTDQPATGLTPIHVYLRESARLASMDFLPDILDAPLGNLDHLSETLAQRSEKMTPLLDGILHQRSIPPRWGINE